jgi:hypothetical protein
MFIDDSEQLSEWFMPLDAELMYSALTVSKHKGASEPQIAEPQIATFLLQASVC